jgi:hypothetical protein
MIKRKTYDASYCARLAQSRTVHSLDQELGTRFFLTLDNMLAPSRTVHSLGQEPHIIRRWGYMKALIDIERMLDVVGQIDTRG